MSTLKSKKNSSNENMSNQKESNHQQLIKKWKIKVSNFSYEEALNKLDEILSSLQNESLPIDNIQTNYLKANILLERCEHLLKEVEQEFIEIDPELLKDQE